MRIWLLAAFLFLFLIQAEAQADANTNSETRVINGERASIKKWPFLTALVLRADPNAFRGFICGGSLLAPRIVLTAAHCVYGSPARDFDIVARRANLQKRGGTRVAVHRILLHPDYNPAQENRDLALLYLQKPIRALYAKPKALLPNGFLRFAGWGQTRSGFLPTLRQGTAQRLDNAECRYIHGHSFVLETMFCARGKKQEPCTGDSGGPLAQGRNLYGVVSWGDASCLQSPTVYARIDTGWISKTKSKWKKK